MTFGKGITKHNKEEYVKTLTESLERLIKYAEEYGITREEAVQEWADNGKEGKINFKDVAYYEYGLLAKHLLEHLDEVALHIHEFCFSPQHIGETVYPESMLKALYCYRSHCYNDTVKDPENNFMSLEEQNESSRNYIHFDFSVKRIKTLKDL